MLLLHRSLAVSRLTEQSKVLVQRQALLEERQRRLEHSRREAQDPDEPAEPVLAGEGADGRARR